MPLIKYALEIPERTPEDPKTRAPRSDLVESARHPEDPDRNNEFRSPGRTLSVCCWTKKTIVPVQEWNELGLSYLGHMHYLGGNLTKSSISINRSWHHTNIHSRYRTWNQYTTPWKGDTWLGISSGRYQSHWLLGNFLERVWVLDGNTSNTTPQPRLRGIELASNRTSILWDVLRKMSFYGAFKAENCPLPPPSDRWLEDSAYLHLWSIGRAHLCSHKREVGGKGSYMPGSNFDIGVRPPLEAYHGLITPDVQQVAHRFESKWGHLSEPLRIKAWQEWSFSREMIALPARKKVDQAMKPRIWREISWQYSTREDTPIW